jgi:hypothetical protein
MRIALLLLASLVFSGAAEAGTICVNERCITCDGAGSCINGRCTCNGAAVHRTNLRRQGPCGGQEMTVHGNGGGRIATTAVVNESVFVSRDSAVCGSASVAGPSRLLNGSTLNGSARVSGRSIIDGSTLNGSPRVVDSSITHSTINGSVSVSNSEIADSTLNGSVVVDYSEIGSSTLNGSVAVRRRRLDHAVLN